MFQRKLPAVNAVCREEGPEKVMYFFSKIKVKEIPPIFWKVQRLTAETASFVPTRQFKTVKVGAQLMAKLRCEKVT